jgi:hypothetical protein
MMRRSAFALAGLLALGLCSCRSPHPAAPPAGSAKGAAQPLAKPQFIFASWSQAKDLILQGQVIQTVSGQSGLALILRDHVWVHLVTKPDDPLPKHPLDFIYKNAPNAASIRHTTE